MELFTFILGVAGTVLSNVITDLVTGRSKAARRAEIERQVEAILSERTPRKAPELKVESGRVMSEIDSLARLDPDLRVNEDRIELAEQIQPGIARPEQQINIELAQRLERLNETVRARRVQLGLPLQPAADVAAGDAGPQEIPTGWEQAPPEPKESEWSRALRDMQDRIRQRRAEGGRPDD